MKEIIEKLKLVAGTLDRVSASGRQNMAGVVIAIDTLGEIAQELEKMEESQAVEVAKLESHAYTEPQASKEGEKQSQKRG